eukprot:Protomagalhaensia_wolfi_Nauph_80__1790@NODE_2116_length_1209_cov_53_595726_g951_i2_p1_GENE_NODE_2116_length_1209_cov_53_595726_g951_i2NODE_2116_length_1209_cov_53_595726_g951_i2_p1_ORF_typecomplete_len203_score21_58DUF4658/PF15555_6/0_78_NODE_2116_length_1209_cov_53_595726_g951_i25981206
MVLSIIAQSQEDHSSSGQKALMVATVIARTTAVRLQDPPHHHRFRVERKSRPISLRRRPRQVRFNEMDQKPLPYQKPPRQVRFNETPETSIVPSSALKFIQKGHAFSTTQPNNASVSAGNYSLLVNGSPDYKQGNGSLVKELRRTRRLIGSTHVAAYLEGVKKTASFKKLLSPHQSIDKAARGRRRSTLVSHVCSPRSGAIL